MVTKRGAGAALMTASLLTIAWLNADDPPALEAADRSSAPGVQMIGQVRVRTVHDVREVAESGEPSRHELDGVRVAVDGEQSHVVALAQKCEGVAGASRRAVNEPPGIRGRPILHRPADCR